ncbi:MAG: hypothetical protein M3413_07070 [Bacteroidota bacterium]|nr:hypothetical protein [Flavisolibacter sp.]MDQ3551273.1 hypothetical protein [Bacteroidota bacterium]
MKMLNFQVMDENKKINILYRQGIYIGKRKFLNFCTVLYQLDSFYVELYYKKYRTYIDKIRVFESTELLEPYLDQIDVEHLVT